MRVTGRGTAYVVVAAALLVAAAGVVASLVLDGRSGGQSQEQRWARAVAADPEDTGARLQLGYAQQQAGRPEDALKQYEAVLAREPRNTAALFNRATVYREMNEDKLAEEGYWDVLEIEEDHIGAAAQLGRLYAAKDQYRSVLAAVRPVVGLRPESAELQYLTGLAYENLGEQQWARERYRLALKASPDMREAREGLERVGGAR